MRIFEDGDGRRIAGKEDATVGRCRRLPLTPRGVDMADGGLKPPQPMSSTWPRTVWGRPGISLASVILELLFCFVKESPLLLPPLNAVLAFRKVTRRRSPRA